jgi:isocitrate/isopropylmalate dehydrogenase
MSQPRRERAYLEAVHGSAPKIVGRGIAKPTALTQSAVLMLS